MHVALSCESGDVRRVSFPSRVYQVFRLVNYTYSSVAFDLNAARVNFRKWVTVEAFSRLNGGKVKVQDELDRRKRAPFNVMA